MLISDFVTPASSRQDAEASQALPAGCRRYKLLSKFRAEMKTHACSTVQEVCGFVYEQHYFPLPNIAGVQDRFYADPASLASVLAQHGEPLGIFHTHPNGSLELSGEDRRLWYYSNSTMIVGCVRNGQLWWKMYGKRRD